jgi:hypothetical protein
VRDEYIHVANPPVAEFSVMANDEVVNFTNQYKAVISTSIPGDGG